MQPYLDCCPENAYRLAGEPLETPPQSSPPTFSVDPGEFGSSNDYGEPS